MVAWEVDTVKKYLIPIFILCLLVSSSFVGVSNTHIKYMVDDKKIVQTSSSGPMDSAWPMKCHDNRHTGRSPYSTADNPYDEIWRFKTDKWVENDPVIDTDGNIYFGCFDRYLHALNPDGAEIWKYKTGGTIIGPSPAINEDGTIYIGSWDDYLYAINPNGTLKWRFCTYDDIYSSPAIGEDGTIYIGTMDIASGKIFAINPDGTEKWRYTTGYYITSDPAISDDGTIYIGSQDDYLYAINPNGTLKWRFKTGDDIKGPPSIADDGTIYVGSYDTYLYAIYPNGTMKWKCDIGYGIATNPSIANDGTIYVGGDRLYAVYPNGTMRWSNNMGGNRHIDSSSPAISADGTIYVGTNIGEVSGGEIIAFNPDGSEQWRKRIANLWVESSPCIAEDGTIYVGSSSQTSGGDSYGYLYAFNRAELSADANGPHYGLINQPVQFNGTGIGGYRPYSWHWNFGDGNSSIERNPSHTYSNPDNYTVTLTVTDDTGNTSDDTTWAWIQESNNPPNKPSITGETDGKKGESYKYTFKTDDPEGLHIWYFVRWGDPSETGWIGPYTSGEGITLSHKWTASNTYTISCMAKDPYGDESEWGELKVTMPKTHHWWLDRFPLLQRLLEWLIR